MSTPYDGKTKRKTSIFTASGSKPVPKGTPVRVYEVENGLARVRVNWPDGTHSRGVMNADDIQANSN